MQVTPHIHALRIPFQVPIRPEIMLNRDVYSYFIFGDTITLIDTGVKGSDAVIFDYIKKNGRDPQEIATVILTHSHPDHLGSVKAIKEATNCKVFAHRGERFWIEDTEREFAERPVPGFHSLVGGPVSVDKFLNDGDKEFFGKDIYCEVIHTPGHSKGSISLFFKDEKALITGDALPLPDDMPIYEDFFATVNSIHRIKNMNGVETLLSSWEPPIHGQKQIIDRIENSMIYLRRIHKTVQMLQHKDSEDIMKFCERVIFEMGLPSAAATPLTARSFASNLSARDCII